MTRPRRAPAARPSRSPVTSAPRQRSGLSYRVVLRQLTSRGRIIGLTPAGAGRDRRRRGRSARATPSLDDAVELVASVGFASVLPVVALVFGGAALGDLRDDKTLVYFWLRPMDRWPIVVGAACAAMTLAAPITLISIVLAAVLTGAGNGIVAGHDHRRRRRR